MKKKEYLLGLIFILLMLFNGCSHMRVDYTSSIHITDLDKLAIIDSSDIITVITIDNKNIEGEFVGFSNLHEDKKKQESLSTASLIIRVKLHGGQILNELISIKNIVEIYVDSKKLKFITGSQNHIKNRNSSGNDNVLSTILVVAIGGGVGYLAAPKAKMFGSTFAPNGKTYILVGALIGGLFGYLMSLDNE